MRLRHRGGKHHADDIGGLPDGQIKSAQHKGQSEQGNRFMVLFDDEVFEIVHRGTVADGVEHQGGNARAQQYPPRAVVKQVLQVFF